MKPSREPSVADATTPENRCTVALLSIATRCNAYDPASGEPLGDLISTGTKRIASIVDGRGGWVLAPERPPATADVHADILRDGKRWGTVFASHLEPHHHVLIAHGLEHLAELIGDVVQRTGALSAREESDASVARQLRQFIEITSTPMFMKDLEGRYIMANRACLGAFPPAAGGIHGRTDLELFPPAVAERLMANDRAVLDHGQISKVQETIPAFDGDRTFITIKFPLRNARNELIGVGGVGTDITTLVEQEQARRDLEERLRHSERLSIVGQLASTVTHDLNNLLAVVQGVAEKLRATSDDEAVRRDAELIADNARRAADIATNVMGISRRSEPHRRPVDVHQLLDSLLDLAARAPGSESVVRHFRADRATVLGDEATLQSLFLNLMTNAKDATPTGAPIEVTTRASEEFLNVIITDRGEGMSAEALNRAFEPFYTTRADEGGTGLGLPSARSSAERHGGSIRIESQPGVGTTVTVSLPLISAETS